jgi:hypothetical protein
VGWLPAAVGTERGALPAPAALTAIAAAGFAAVLVLPEIASALPRGDDPEPNATQLAVTSAAVLWLTGAYLYVAARRAGLGTAWLVLAFTYNAAIVMVKFILSPASFQHRSQTTLAGYIWVGLAVMLFYGAGLAAVFLTARRQRVGGSWSWASKAGLVVALVVFAMASRYVAAVALGQAASDYLDRASSGAGLWLPALIAGASLAAVAAFDRASDLQAALRIGLALIVVYHLLWALFMLRLF